VKRFDKAWKNRELTVQKQVLQNSANAVLGREGERLREIQRSSGARVTVAICEERVSDQPSATITISGSSEACEMAKSLVDVTIDGSDSIPAVAAASTSRTPSPVSALTTNAPLFCVASNGSVGDPFSFGNAGFFEQYPTSRSYSPTSVALPCRMPLTPTPEEGQEKEVHCISIGLLDLGL
jgi:hypothetical protein